MHAVYYKKLNIVLLDYIITTVKTLKITAYVENDHCFYSAKWQPSEEKTCLTTRT